MKKIFSLITIIVFVFSIIQLEDSVSVTSITKDISRNLSYIVNVSKNGNATIKIIFSSSKKGIFSLYLPRYETVKINIYNGTFTWVKNKTMGYWYYLATFRYTPLSGKEFQMVFRYSFPWASLMVDDKGWFMTPLIGTDNDIEVTVNVSLYNYKKDIFFVPRPIWKKDGFFEFKLRDTLNGSRITIYYFLKKEITDSVVSEKINNTLISVHSPSYYSVFAKKIINVMEKSLKHIKYVFGDLPEKIDFKFFLPKDFPKTLGYVMGEDINIGGKGPININLALIRFVEGYLETTVIHEYIHLALGRIGVEANNKLRWFHEGVAQYLSLLICQKVGVNVTDIKMTLDQGSMSLAPPFGYLQEWSSGPEQGMYYLASYKIVKELAVKYGGIDFFRKFSTEAKKYGKIETNEDLVEVLSNAVGEDLTPYFKSLGFHLIKVEKNKRIPIGNLEQIRIIAAVIIILVVVTAVYFLFSDRRHRKEYKICPYCNSRIPADALYCPYCGMCQLDMYYGEEYKEYKK